MTGRLLPPLALLLIAAPAQATGGFVCQTAGPDPIKASMGFGHVPGAPLILTQLIDRGRVVPVKPAQWWLDNQELRLLLISEDARNEEAVLRALRNGHFYDGTMQRGGKRRWVRCRES